MHAGASPSIVDRIHAGIDDLLATDLATVDDDALLAATFEVYRAEARLTAARSRLLAEVDQREAYAPSGAQSAAAYVATTCRLPRGVARQQVMTARALRHLPATSERLADGDLNERHASRIGSCWINERMREATERDDEVLSTEGARLPFRLFEKVLAYWMQLADPDGTDEDAEARRARRHLYLSRTLDGCVKVDGLLDPIGGTAVLEAVRRLEQGLFETDAAEARARLSRDPIEGDLVRSAKQRRADALVQLAHDAVATPAGARRPAPLVSVLCSYETFAGRICELADGTVVAPSNVTALLDEAIIERAVFDGPSRVLEVGHQRRFTGAIRRAIELRDLTCTHPYCDRPAPRCDIDHVEPWAAGGLTTQQNGRVYCPFHNHRRQRRPEPDSDGP